MTNPFFILGGRKVGLDFPPLIIAEIGINHEGSLDVAIEMADAAINSGAEVVKHQTHVISDEMSKAAKQVVPGNAKESIYEIMSRCALSESDERALMSHVESRGAIFISTPFSRAAAERLEKFDVCGYKIGSGECNNYPLIEHIAKFGKPIILSTGMNDLASIEKSVSIFRRYKVPYALLHCTNVYPTPDNLVRLGGVTQLIERFEDAVVGLSDHSLGNLACLGSVSLGASILERHFTDSMDREGPDIVCSMTPKECADLIKDSNRLFLMRGGVKGIVDEERVTADFAYSSVVSISEIKAGELLSEANIWVKRPGTGDFSADDFKSLLGKRAVVDIKCDIQLTMDMVVG